MGIMEIVLLIAGGIIFILSFLIPEKKGEVSGTFREEEIRELVNQELESVRNHVDEVVEEAVTYAVEKTERSLERLSNEKIMAVNEYSESVLAQIHKDHEEAMFLYDMLNNKHVSLKDTMSEVTRTVREAQEVIDGLGKLSSEELLSSSDGKVEEPKMPIPNLVEEPEVLPEKELQELLSADKPESVAEGGEEERNNNERILELYRQGKNAVTIARELSLGVGEVKLVIDLFQK